MKSKLIQSVPAVLAIAFVGLTNFSVWCTGTGHFCYRTWLDRIFIDTVSPLYFFSLYSLPITIILVFVPRLIFNTWLKFAAWSIPLFMYYIFTTDVNFTGIGLNLFPFYRDDAARLSAEIFSAVSLIVIAFALLCLRFVKTVGKEREYEVRGLKALVAVGISLLAAAVFSYELISNGSLDIFILSGIASVAAALLTLYQVLILSYQKLRGNLAFGPKLKTSMFLLAMDILIYIGFYLFVVR